MSLAGYLFGNVDEQGRLDNDLDDELKQTLQHVDANVFTRIFNPATFGMQSSHHNQADLDEDDEEDDYVDNVTSVYKRQSTHTATTTQHAAGAIDYSDFDETVPDEISTGTKTQATASLQHRSLFKPTEYPSYRTGSLLTIPRMPVKRMKPPTRSILSKRYHIEEDDDYDTQYDDDSNNNNAFGIGPLHDSTAPSSWHHHQLNTPIPTLSPSSSPVTSASPPTIPETIDITQLFPAFKQGKVLNFSDLFMTRIKRRTKFQTPQPRVLMNDGFRYEMDLDQQQMFIHQPLKRRKLSVTNDLDYQGEGQEFMQQSHAPCDSSYRNYLSEDNDHLYYPVMLEPWENNILWDEDDSERYSPVTNTAPYTTISNDMVNTNSIKEIVLNKDLDSGNWLNDVLWDDNNTRGLSTYIPNGIQSQQSFDPESIKIILDLNDPHMLFDAESMEENQQRFLPIKNAVKKGRKPNPRPIPKMPLIYTSDSDSRSKLPQTRYNISNDRYYDMNFAVVRVRQTHGQLVVQHSIPALQLHRTLYKTKLSKSELRSFHRHFFQWPFNTDINFTRVRLIKKKLKIKKQQQLSSGMERDSSSIGSNGDNDTTIRTTKDLSLKDTSSFVLLEYSEEHPSIISNVGMGTLIVNYYRKTDPKDDYVPNMEIGEPFVLEVEDTSPFMTFGNVEPGQTISVMYNNMVRAPLFRHQVQSTDFLLIRSTYHGQPKYYIREIPTIFVMGQTYPVQEVPGPQSRRVTTTVKNRLQIVAYRLIGKHPQLRLKMSKLASRFPEYQDIQVRQRLKEFLEFNRHRKEKGGGYWKVRQSVGGVERKPPGEDQLRQMCTPEMVCLYESMLVGERHLMDLGYDNVIDTADQDESNASQLETEQQLAPWFATRNFINACQGKAMLKLSGDGDPTGCGEGFSFIRVSMKDIFLRAGESAEKKLAQIKARPKSAHRYNVAEQQQVYKEEIERIWSNQWNSLSRVEEPEYSLLDMMDESSADEREIDHTNSPMTPDNIDWRHRRRFDRTASEGFYDDATDDTISVAESYNSHMHKNRELRITRHMRDNTGEIKIVVEVVKDPAVIKAYLGQRQLIMESAASLEALDPTNSREKNARLKKQTQHQLDKLKKMAERRRQRELSKSAALAENPVLGLMRGKKEGAMRRCGNCGQLGHMKTNKKCPRFPTDEDMNNSKTTDNQVICDDDTLDDGSQTPLSSFTSPPPPSTSSYTFASL